MESLTDSQSESRWDYARKVIIQKGTVGQRGSLTEQQHICKTWLKNCLGRNEAKFKQVEGLETEVSSVPCDNESLPFVFCFFFFGDMVTSVTSKQLSQ